MNNINLKRPNRPRNIFITSKDSHQRMLACEPGDAFHEMFTHVVRVRALVNNKVVVTEHSGTGPSLRTKLFNSREDFAHHYSYKSEGMKNKSVLSWAPTGFGHREELKCICSPVDLLNNGCRCV